MLQKDPKTESFLGKLKLVSQVSPWAKDQYKLPSEGKFMLTIPK